MQQRKATAPIPSPQVMKASQANKSHGKERKKRAQTPPPEVM